MNKNSESAMYLARNIEHEFSWYVPTIAPENTLKRRILEADFTKLIILSLNEKPDYDGLMLFRNGTIRRYTF